MISDFTNYSFNVMTLILLDQKTLLIVIFNLKHVARANTSTLKREKETPIEKKNWKNKIKKEHQDLRDSLT